MSDNMGDNKLDYKGGKLEKDEVTGHVDTIACV